MNTMNSAARYTESVINVHLSDVELCSELHWEGPIEAFVAETAVQESRDDSNDENRGDVAQFTFDEAMATLDVPALRERARLASMQIEGEC